MPAKFSILVKKNVKVGLRVKRKLVIELLIVLVVGIVAVVNPIMHGEYSELASSELEKTQFFDGDPLDNLNHLVRLLNLKRIPLKFSLAYTPENPIVKEILQSVIATLKLRSTVLFVNDEAMENHFDQRNTLAGIVFNSFDKNTTQVPKNLNVTIRFPSLFRTIEMTKDNVDIWVTRCHGIIINDANDEDEDVNKGLYLREGFLQLQHLIFLEWYKRAVAAYGGTQIDYNVTVRSFRHSVEADKCNIATFSNLTAFLYCFTFLLPFLNMIWKFGRERENDLYAQHMMLGMGHMKYWFSHFVVSFVRMIPHCLLFMVIVKIPWTDDPLSGIFYQTNPLYLLLFLLFYVAGLVVCALFFGVVVMNAKNAVYLGLVVWLSCYGLFALVLEQTAQGHSQYILMTFVIFINNAFPHCMDHLQNYDRRTHSENFWLILSVLTVNIFVYWLLVDYVLAKHPGRYMDRRPMSFFGLRSICKRKRTPRTRIKKVAIVGRTPSWHNFDYGPIGGDEYISIRNVCTYYGPHQEKQKLTNLSMKAYKGEITAIVGHCTSGKTTIMNLLSGWRRTDVGVVRLCKLDIYDDWHKARRLLGVVMPNNALIDLLTCEETLVYFVSLKQETKDEDLLRLEVDKWLEVLHSTVPKDLLVRKMTFEQKRLLCLCCAMSCQTKIILLDEPVLHMRSKEERLFFSIMQREKPDRAIVFTTFSFHTAETTADRIGILVNGVLKAYGTPFFLKNKFGYGYDLILIRDMEFTTQPITALLDGFFPNIVPDNEIGNQIVYKIPQNKRPKFQLMLLHLEREKENLGILEIRLVSTDLNEVYQTLDTRKNNQVISDYTKILKVTYLSQRDLSKQQFRAMLYKKMLHQAPNIIPCIMIFVSIFLILFIGRLSDVMGIPVVHYDGFQLGLSKNSTDRQLFNSIGNCQFINVKQLQHDSSQRKIDSLSRVFTSSSLHCGTTDFPSFIKNSKSLNDKVGAIEVFKNASAVVWVNQRKFHSAPVALNLLHNFILNESFPQDSGVVATLQSHPMRMPLKVKIYLVDQTFTHLRVPMTVGIIVPTTVSTFIFPIVEERRNHLLLLQEMAGMRMDFYWLVNLLWDSLTFFAYMVIYIIVMAFVTIEGFNIRAKIVLLLLLGIYGISALLMTYLISMFTYKSKWRAFLICCIIQLTTGICTYIFYWDVAENSKIVFYLAALSPTFALLDGVSNLYAESKEKQFCWERCDAIQQCNADIMCELIPQCCFDTFFKFEDPGILSNVFLILASGALYAFIMFWVDLSRAEQKFHQTEDVKSRRSACYDYDDINVVEMKRYIAEADMRDIRTKRFVVDQVENMVTKDGAPLHTVSFTVNKSECLCLLGTRHCGKSHLMRQLIGEDGFKFGDVYVMGKELKYEMTDCHKIMGYCPQDYGLEGSYRIRELMYIICMIRGVLPIVIPDIISDIALSLDIKRLMYRKISSLSYDQKRKVNIALSFLVYNKILILDEPTRGVSPHIRREIWNVLRYARFCGKTLVVTTSSVAECMQLADQTILYEDNEMLAAGSIHFLRNHYTKGFYLEVKLLRDGATLEESEKNLHRDVENLKRFVSFMHQGSELIRRVDTTLKFYLPVPMITFSILYGTMEKNRHRLNIVEYSVTQGSVNDVLKNINSRRQHPRITPKRKD